MPGRARKSGDDACTYFNIGDPFTKRDLRTYFRDKQVHISGDVAIAMWEYFKITGDDSLLLEGGAEVILECARFYYSYAYFKKDKNRYEILDVIGPDEYHERVNNNAFTSMVAKATFEIANADGELSEAKTSGPVQSAGQENWISPVNCRCSWRRRICFMFRNRMKKPG